MRHSWVCGNLRLQQSVHHIRTHRVRNLRRLLPFNVSSSTSKTAQSPSWTCPATPLTTSLVTLKAFLPMMTGSTKLRSVVPARDNTVRYLHIHIYTYAHTSYKWAVFPTKASRVTVSLQNQFVSREHAGCKTSSNVMCYTVDLLIKPLCKQTAQMRPRGGRTSEYVEHGVQGGTEHVLDVAHYSPHCVICGVEDVPANNHRIHEANVDGSWET